MDGEAVRLLGFKAMEGSANEALNEVGLVGGLGADAVLGGAELGASGLELGLGHEVQGNFNGRGLAHVEGFLKKDENQFQQRSIDQVEEGILPGQPEDRLQDR